MRFYLFLIAIICTTLSYSQAISDSLIIEEDMHVNYASDKYDITPGDNERINVLVRKYFDPAYFFRLDAYTDTDGSDEYNITLSRKRCDAIKQILIDKKIAEERIDYYSHGENFLLVQETDTNQKSKNRRATIKVFKKTEFIAFQGNLTPENSQEIITGDIHIQYDSHKNVISTDSSGVYKLNVPTNKKIELNILAKNHFPFKKEIKLTSKSRTDAIKFPLTKYSINNAINATIQFKGNKSIVLKQSLSELEFLGLSLLSNPDVCVELQGHINRPNEKPIEKEHVDYGLSIARSLEIFDHLEKQGISNKRMLARGYGNSRMLFPRASGDKEETANRRVEVRMISCDETATLENDTVEDLGFYKEVDKFSRDFKFESKEQDLAHFPERIQVELNAQISYMLQSKIDPEEHSYFDLLYMARRRSKM